MAKESEVTEIILAVMFIIMGVFLLGLWKITFWFYCMYFCCFSDVSLVSSWETEIKNESRSKKSFTWTIILSLIFDLIINYRLRTYCDQRQTSSIIFLYNLEVQRNTKMQICRHYIFLPTMSSNANLCQCYDAH